ncbi:MAG: fumarylacetoacetate hydrolase family protein [Leucobacter sp.]
MHLISFTTATGASWGFAEGSKIRDVGALASPAARTLGGALRSGEYETLLGHADTAPAIDLAAVEALPPITDAGKIICIGLNYADHIAEMNRPTPKRPVIFSRFNDTLVGHEQPLVAPLASEQFDYEGEFCVVIGRGGRRIAPDRALDHVLGYTIMNDGSVRDYQRHTHQFTPGKNFPRSGALGPAIVTKDEFGAVASQRITTRINGDTVQDSTADQLVFDVAELIAYCSEWTELSPGDLIATGTPGGVGDGFDPKLWLHPGDTVEVTIEGIGTLSNPVAAEV